MKYLLIILAVVMLLGVAGLYYLGQRSQAGEAIGLVDGKLAPCPSAPNCVASENGETEDKSVAPLPVEVWNFLPAVIAEMGGIVVKKGPAYISAEFTSDTFKFVDDVEFRLAKDAVHVRSASRVGYSDNGVNGVRMAALRKKFEGRE